MKIEFDAGEGYNLIGEHNAFTVTQCASGDWCVDDDNLGGRINAGALNKAIDYCLNNDKEYVE